MDSLNGSCLCGAVRYQLKAKPKAVYYCHCNDCKRSTGSAFHVGLVMLAKDVDIQAETLKSYTLTAESGNHMTREFCGHCGSPLFTKDSGAPENLVVKAGSLEKPELVQPIAELWTVHKVSWANIPDGIRSLEKGKALDL